MVDQDDSENPVSGDTGMDEAYLVDLLLQHFDAVIAHFPKESASYITLASQYAEHLFTKYERWERKKDLEEAIKKTRNLTTTAPSGHPNQAGWLNNLGKMLNIQYERTGSMEDLEDAIRCARDAAAAIPDDHPDRVDCLNNFGNMLESRYERTGGISDLEEAIRYARNAVAATPNDYLTRPTLLNNLGAKLQRRYKRTRRIEDLEEGVQCARDAVAATAKDHPHRPICLTNLGSELEYRYERTGRLEDLEEAIQCARDAVAAATLNNHPVRPACLGNLGKLLEDRYERTGKVKDLEEATKCARDAVMVTPNDHPERPRRLNNLGNKLDGRYRRTGRVGDLEEAIQCARDAVAATPDKHPNRVDYLSNLGGKLSSQYERTGRMEELEEAIRCARDAVAAAIHNNHPSQPGCLNNLGGVLQSRHERTGRIEDLEEAIQCARDAVTAILGDHPDRQAWLNNLGNKLHSRYERTGRIEDQEEAVQCARDAVAATPDDHPGRAGWLNNLGSKLHSRYERTGRIEDQEEAVQCSRDAVAATPDDHPNRAGYLSNLGNTLECRYERTGSMQDHDSALHIYLTAWSVCNAIPLNRLKAAVSALRLLKGQQDWLQASQLAVEAVELLPLMHNRTLSRHDQEYIVSHFSGLGADACSLLLMQDSVSETNVGKALETLELGRGAILNLLIDDRSDLSKLRANFPHEATVFENLQAQLNKPVTAEGGDPKTPRSIIVQNLDQCINRIRLLPGHEQFLHPPSPKEIKEMATNGPIVVINVTQIRSDAILISTSSIQALPLPQFQASEIRQWSAQDLLDFDQKTEGDKNREYTKFLSWLWDTCVGPVLQTLQICASASTENRPRVWWIGAGLATALPFHAAGDHASSSTQNTVSVAISSYTPTLKALRYARERARRSGQSAHDQPRLLTVAMPTTPGHRELPGVIEEVTQVERLAQNSFTTQSLQWPSCDAVMNRLADHDIVHFACHGLSNVLDPSESCMILQHRGASDSDYAVDPLRVSDVSQLRLDNARIAFLSACSTAENSAQAPLADEVIHLASGFQVAGFPHVIGSLWFSADKICVTVAEEFYRRITTSNWSNVVDRDVASALHESVLRIRSQGRNSKAPLLWAQYVHFGA